jgi:hypothetical protein
MCDLKIQHVVSLIEHNIESRQCLFITFLNRNSSFKETIDYQDNKKIT